MAETSDHKEVTSVSAAVEGTQRFYEIEAERYARQTRQADLTELRARFLSVVRAGGTLLDVGCGAGRDLRAFRLLGFHAIGLEPSEALARIARAYSGCEVRVGRVEELTCPPEFDGVWACASLLHLPRAALPGALARIRSAATPGAAFFLSMQLGSGEFTAPDGRFFALYQSDALSFIVGAAGFDLTDVWESGDSLGERPIRWINLLARANSGHL